MSKKNILTKEFKYEDYILIVVGIIVVICGILTLLGVITFEEEVNGQINGNDTIIGIVFCAFGLLCSLIGFVRIKKQKKLKTTSVYYPIYEDYKNNKIKSDLAILGLDVSKVNFEKMDYALEINYSCGQGFFSLVVSDYYVEILYYYNDEIYEGDESLINEELENAYVELDACKISKDKVYNKFIAFINEYEHLAK